MTVAEVIAARLKRLPESLQAEVLDFVEYLGRKTSTAGIAEEESAWSAASLAGAMRGLEDEPSPYSLDDLREVFS